MKKIAYLVAPLMVMPFLIGCNSIKTHKIQSVLSVESKLKFYTMKGKELKNSTFNHKQTLKFKVEAVDEAEYSIDPYGIGIYVGKDAVMPLLDGYTIEYTKADKTAATVTILANKVTDDIYIDSIAAKEGNYIYSVPVMLGVQMPEGKATLGWQEKGKKLDLEFEGVGEEENPTADCFLYTDDAETFHYDDDESEFMKNVNVDLNVGGRTKVTIKENSIKTGYLLVAARSGSKVSFLDAFSWDEIAEIANEGIAPYLFNVGDRKKVKFKTTGEEEVEHTVKVIGFDHDTLTTGGKASITFQFATAISDASGKALTMVWNDKEQSSKNFENASINDTTGKVLELLPEDLQNNIKPVTKYVGKYINGKWGAQPYTASLFPLSDKEVSENPRTRGSSSIDIYYVPNEGTTYEYYKGVDTHQQRLVTGVDGKACTTWLRSPNTYLDDDTELYDLANCFDEEGYLLNGRRVNQHAYALAPAFCI